MSVQGFFLNFEVGWVHNNIVKYLKFQKTHENSVKSLEKLCKTLWAVYDYDRFTWKIHNFVEITIFYLHKIFNIKNTINWWRKRKRSSLNRFIHEKIWLLIYVILFCQIFCFCGMALKLITKPLGVLNHFILSSLDNEDFAASSIKL